MFPTNRLKNTQEYQQNITSNTLVLISVYGIPEITYIFNTEIVIGAHAG